MAGKKRTYRQKINKAKKTPKKTKAPKKSSKPSVLGIFLVLGSFLACGYLIFFFVSTYLNFDKPKPPSPSTAKSVASTSSTQTTENSKPNTENQTPKTDPTPTITDVIIDLELPDDPPTEPIVVPTLLENTGDEEKTDTERVSARATPTDDESIAATGDRDNTVTKTELPPPTIRERGKIYQINPSLPKVCIIVDDFGNIGTSLFERFNSIDKNVSFAVIPDYPRSITHMENAIAAGREVIIHIPMQPDTDDAKLEPNTIMTTMSDYEIQTQIESWMKQLPKAIGANNHMGSLATTDERVMSRVLMTLSQNNLFFVDSATTSNSIARRVANSLGVKTIARDIFLDVPDSSQRNARAKITEMRNLSNKETIVVITHCHNDVKFRQLVHFIDRLKDGGYQLIPVSQAVR